MNDAITTREAVAQLRERHGVIVSVDTLRRRIDALGLGGRFGLYRAISEADLTTLAELLTREGFASTAKAS